MIIDIHNHFYAPKLLEAIEQQTFSKDLWIEKDSWGRKIIVQKGTRVVTITEPMSNPEMRIEDMKTAGVDMQTLSLSIPSVDFFQPDTGYEFAQLSNNAIADICQHYPGYFLGFASVPLKDPDRAIDEAKRAVTELGMKGVCIGTNIDGQVIDSQKFWPFFTEMEKLSVPIFIHPMTPPGSEAMKAYRLAPMIGFEMDICLAVARILFSGIIEKHPALTFIISHLGGAIPYLIERIENCYKAYPECRDHISTNPSDYLHKIYFDTVSFYEPALMCAYAFTTAQKLVMGSDYPHVIGDLNRAVTSITTLSIPENEKDMILGKNIEKMFGLNGSKR
jgi:aminocarboxymuconate-semialdehyde decarboxylase